MIFSYQILDDAKDGDLPLGVFQHRVQQWMLNCFGHRVADNRIERGDRFLEEALEFLQAIGYDFGRIPALVEYVRNRPPGEPSQEVGGVLITLAAACNQSEVFMRVAAQDEIKRIEQPAVMSRIREKQQRKRDIFGPMP